MSGHMVSVAAKGVRHFYMANIADPQKASKAVSGKANIANAETLTPLADATLKKFQVPTGEVRHFHTDGSEGPVGGGR